MSLNNDDDDGDEINHDDNDIRLTTVSGVMFVTMINKNDTAGKPRWRRARQREREAEAARACQARGGGGKVIAINHDH